MRLAWLLGSLLLAPAAAAHPLAPAFLALKETEPALYEVQWRAAALASTAHLQPQFPPHCRQRGEGRSSVEGGAFIARWMLDCSPGGLVGQPLRIAGLEETPLNVILRVEPRHGEVTQLLLDARQPSVTLADAATRPPVWRSYLGLGVEHLWNGLDHLLFVLGLVGLLQKPWQRLCVAVTAFTLGHSVTLALATLGWLPVSVPLAEFGIAASLLWLALELTRPQAQALSLLARRPALLPAAFGLLHGLGFASALREAGLPSQDVPAALLCFNLGIELGQLGLVCAGLAVVATWQRLRRPAFRRAPAYGLGALAGYWCLERATALFG